MSQAYAFLTFLDAVAHADMPCGAVQLHDYNGLLLASLRTWAGSRNLDVRRVALELPERIWDAFSVHVGKCEVTIHDERSRRPNPALENAAQGEAA